MLPLGKESRKRVHFSLSVAIDFESTRNRGYGVGSMIGDRPYMSSSFEPTQPRSITIYILIANAVFFFLQAIIERSNTGYLMMQEYFYLSLPGFSSGKIWQLITFQFLHGGLMHLLVNCLVIFFMGRHVERRLGGLAFLRLYLTSGVVGGLVQLVLLAMEGGDSGYVRAVVGASAGAYGLVAAYATLFPNERIELLLFFVLPVSFVARYLFLCGVILSVLGIVSDEGHVAHAAHLGGLLSGAAIIMWTTDPQSALRRWVQRWVPSFKKRPSIRVVKETKRSPRATQKPNGPKPSSPAASASGASEDFISREVDPILDKINEHGFQSLTEEEKRILELATGRVRRR